MFSGKVKYYLRLAADKSLTKKRRKELIRQAAEELTWSDIVVMLQKAYGFDMDQKENLSKVIGFLEITVNVPDDGPEKEVLNKTISMRRGTIVVNVVLPSANDKGPVFFKHCDKPMQMSNEVQHAIKRMNIIGKQTAIFAKKFNFMKNASKLDILD